MSVERIADGVYLCSAEETAPLKKSVKPITKGGDYRTWFCPECGRKIKYKYDDICPCCYRLIDWEGK